MVQPERLNEAAVVLLKQEVCRPQQCHDHAVARVCRRCDQRSDRGRLSGLDIPERQASGTRSVSREWGRGPRIESTTVQSDSRVAVDKSRPTNDASMRSRSVAANEHPVSIAARGRRYQSRTTSVGRFRKGAHYPAKGTLSGRERNCCNSTAAGESASPVGFNGALRTALTKPRGRSAAFCST